MIVFPALRVAQMGDMFAWKDGPLCDRNNGGSCVSVSEDACRRAAALKNIDTVIPGHSPMMTVSDVQEYQRFMADLVASSQAAMKAGKTVDEAFAAFSLAKYPGYKNERRQGGDSGHLRRVEIGRYRAIRAKRHLDERFGHTALFSAFRPNCLRMSSNVISSCPIYA